MAAAGSSPPTAGCTPTSRQVREAALRALSYLGEIYKGGYVPPGTLSWNDADDNNAYHSKLVVMDLDGTLSTEVAMIHDKQAYYHEMVVECRLSWMRVNQGADLQRKIGRFRVREPFPGLHDLTVRIQ